ncbi:MAG: hypothetical protein FJ225_03745 [Lentisphaerae bacterium]|nr:hypothetical protein [Lentisphaerota bacterium]
MNTRAFSSSGAGRCDSGTHPGPARWAGAPLPGGEPTPPPLPAGAPLPGGDCPVTCLSQIPSSEGCRRAGGGGVGLFSLALFSGFVLLFTPAATRAQFPAPLVAAELTAERADIYVNEHFSVVLEVRAGGAPIRPSFKLTSLPPPGVLTFDQFRELRAERRIEDGRAVDVRRFRTAARAPAAGPVEAAPTLIVESFMPGRAYEVPVTPLRLNVRELPAEGRPDDFSGAVGTFRLEAGVTPAEIVLGDLVTARITVSGTGHFPERAPAVVADAPGLFKIYEPSLVSREENRLVYEQVIVPQGTNAAAVPAVRLSFFEPLSGAYVNLSQGPFPLTYAPKREGAAFARYRPAEQAGVGDARRPGRTASLGYAARMALAAVAYWILAAGAAFAAAVRAARKRAAALAALLAAAALFAPFRAGLRALLAPPRNAVMARDATARFAPAHASVAGFELSAGTAVRLVETSGDWAKIESRGNRGWVPRASLEAR